MGRAEVSNVGAGGKAPSGNDGHLLGTVSNYTHSGTAGPKHWKDMDGWPLRTAPRWFANGGY